MYMSDFALPKGVFWSFERRELAISRTVGLESRASRHSKTPPRRI